MTSLVMVHGFMGGSRQWEAQRAAFGSRFDMPQLDLPGYGENAHLEAPDTIHGFAAWVLDELTARGVERFHLLGHSMGGMIVQEMVAQAPDRIDKLVLYGTGAIGVLPGRFETIETSKQRTRQDGPQATARRISATWFLRRETAAAYESCAAIAERSSLQAMLAGLDAMQGWSGTDNLSNIQSRTLVIWGDHDRTYLWGQIEKLWHTIAGANLAVIPGCAHAAHLEKPQLFNAVLDDFLMA